MSRLLLANWQTEAKPTIGASVWCENCRQVTLLGGLAGVKTEPLAVRLINCEAMLVTNVSSWPLEELVHETRPDGTEIHVPANPQQQSSLTGYY